MNEIFNVGKTILLDGEPLSLVTVSGVNSWVTKGIGFTVQHDQVVDPLDRQTKYRRLYHKQGADIPFVLVNNHDGEDGGRVTLFEEVAGFDSVPDLPRQ